jgi:hypothetical protein
MNGSEMEVSLTKPFYPNVNVLLEGDKKAELAQKIPVTEETLELIRPYLYVVGASFDTSSNADTVLLDNGLKDIDTLVDSIQDDYRKQVNNPSAILPQKNKIYNILSSKNNWGKIVAVIKGEIILFDTEKIENSEENLEKLKQELEVGKTLKKGVEIPLSVFAKRDINAPKASDNIRGGLLRYYSDGKGNFYKLDINEKIIKPNGQEIYVEIPLTAEDIINEVKSTRVQIDDKALRDTNNKSVLKVAASVLSYRGNPEYPLAYANIPVTLPFGKDKNAEATIETVEDIIAPKTVQSAKEPVKQKPTKKGRSNEIIFSVDTTEESTEPVKKLIPKKADKNLVPYYFNNDTSSTVGEILDKIANSNHKLAPLAAKLLKYKDINDVQIFLDDVPFYKFKKKSLGDKEFKASGFFDPNNNTIRIAAKSKHRYGRSEGLLLHEILHALSKQYLAQNNKYTKDFIKLYEASIEKIGKFNPDTKENYANFTIDEFFVGIFTDSKFIRKLMETEPIDDIKYLNLFEQLAAFFLNLFGITKKDSLFTQAMSVASYILEDQLINVEANNNISENDYKDFNDDYNIDESETDDLGVSDWTTSEISLFSKFIGGTLLNNFLTSTFENSNNINHILETNKNESISSILRKFKNSFKDVISKHFEDTVDKYDLDDDAYEQFQSLINDITNQYLNNKDFEKIVDSKVSKYVDGTLSFNDTNPDEDINESELDNQTDEDTDEETKDYEAWMVEASKIDSKKRASRRLREFFAKIPIKSVKLINNVYNRNQITDSLVYSPQYFDGNYIHNKLLLELSDKNTYEEFLETLNSLPNTYIWGIDILQNILDITSEEAMKRFNSGTLKLPVDLITNSKNYKINDWILKDMYYAIADQTTQNKIALINSNNPSEIGTLVNLITNNDYENTLSTLKESASKIRTNNNKKTEILAQLDDIINKIENNTHAIKDYIDFFNILGYSPVNELLVHINPLTNGTFKIGSESSTSKMNSAIKRFKEYLNSGSNSKLEVYSKALADLINKYQIFSSNLSFTNIKNEMEFAHVPSNFLVRQFNEIKKDVKKWVNKKTKDLETGVDVVLQARNPFYRDLLNDQHHIKLFDDGFVSTKNQINSGKEYKDYNEKDVIVNSINATMASISEDAKKQKGILDIKGSIIKHALFHLGVFSDSPKRYFIQTPLFSITDVVDKLVEISFGELERIRLTSNNSFTKYDHLNENGKLFQIIGELNDVVVYDINNEPLNLVSFLSKWSQYGDVTIPEPFSAIIIEGKTYEAQEFGKTSNEIFTKIVNEIMNNYYNNYKSYLVSQDVAAISNGQLVRSKNSKLYNNFFDGDNAALYYYNKFYVNVFSQLAFAGDPAHYKKNPNNGYTDIDIVKRYKQNISPNIRYIQDDPSLRVIILKDIEIETPHFTKKTKEGLIQNKKASISDAGAYHTIARRKELIIASNQNLELLEVLDKLDNGTYTKEDLQVVFQPMKPFVYTTLQQKGVNGETIDTPFQLKNSEVLLVPAVAYEVSDSENFIRPTKISDIENGKYVHPDLAKILFIMEQNKVKIAVYDTGSKAENFNIINIDDINDSNFKFEDKIIDPGSTSHGDQMVVPEKHIDAQVLLAGQQSKIMSANIDESFSFKYEGITYSGSEGVNSLLQKMSIKDIQNNHKKIKKSLHDKSGKVDSKKFYKLIENKLLESDVNIQKLQALNLQQDGKPLLPIEMMGKKVQQFVNSIYKKVSSTKVRGAALVNMPSVGFITRYGKETDKGSFSSNLQLVTEETPNGKIIKHWEAMVPVYDPIIYRYIDQNGNLLLDNNNKPLIPEQLLHGFFYRIPTEDKYSMYHVKIVKFLPQAQGGTIILPREATEMTGLDFDIDKLYGFWYNVDVKTTADTFDTVIEEFANNGIEITQEQVVEYIDLYNEGEFTEDMNQEYEILNSALLKVYEITGERKLDVSVTESNINTKKGRENLRLDLYLKLTQTPAFAKSAFNPGNKDRLKAYKEKNQNQQGQRNSFADPVKEAVTAVRNITGKALIGIFANANAFYNQIQGNVVLELRSPINVFGNEFMNIGHISEDISRNIAEVLFASTEDVKDPVLEINGINKLTASVYVLLASLSKKEKDQVTTLTLEQILDFLNTPDFVKLVNKAKNDNKRLSDVAKGSKYENIIKLSEEYSSLITAAKVDTQIGPDFYAVLNKINTINALRNSQENEISFITNISDALPGTSKIPSLNEYYAILLEEMSLFKEYFSFLLPSVQDILKILGLYTNSGALNVKLQHKLSYYIYDIVIHNLLEDMGMLSDLTMNVPIELDDLNNFNKDTLILRNYLSNVNGDIEMGKINTTGTDILDTLKGAFSVLFDTNPEFAERLATYSFIKGTNFKMDNFSKLVPNEYWKTEIGEVIRSIINGNSLETLITKYNITEDDIIKNHFSQIFRKLNTEEVSNWNDGNVTFSDKQYVWYEDGNNQILLEKHPVLGWEIFYVKESKILSYTDSTKAFYKNKLDKKQQTVDKAQQAFDKLSTAPDNSDIPFPTVEYGVEETPDPNELFLDDVVISDVNDVKIDLKEIQNELNIENVENMKKDPDFLRYYIDELKKNPEVTEDEVLALYLKCGKKIGNI